MRKKLLLGLLALCGLLCLLLGLRLPGEVRVSRLPAGRAYTLNAPIRETLHMEDGEHDHTVSGTLPAALVLSSPGDGSRALCLELCRRGVTVLQTGGEAAPAWDALLRLPGVSLAAAALIASPGRGEEAAALAGELVGSGRACAALVLLGTEPGESPARNILCLAKGGAGLGPIEGYFAEGTARRTVGVPALCWESRETLLPVIDWLGSALGHRIEIPDEDLFCLRTRPLRWAGLALLTVDAALAAVIIKSKKRKGEEP